MIPGKLKYLLALLLLLNLNTAKASVDSLNLVLETAKNQKNIPQELKVHLELGKTHYEEEAYEKSVFHYNQAIEIGKILENYASISESLLGKAISNQRLNNFPDALLAYNELLELPEEFLTPEVKAKAFNKIGVIYQNLGDFDKAYNYQFQSLKIFEALEDQEGISRIYYAMGTIFYYQNQLEESLKHYLLCMAISEKLNKERNIYACLEALGSLYQKMNDSKTSAEYTRKSLALAQKMNYKTGIAYGLGNLASDKQKNKEYQEAEKLFLESIELKKELSDTWGVIGGLHSLAMCYLDERQPQKSIKTLKEAEKLSLEIDSRPRLLQTYECFKRAYKESGDTNLALEYIEKYVALRDSVFNDKLAEEMGQTKNRYEIEQKENEIAILKKDNEIFETNKELQKLQKYISLIVVIFLLGFSYIIFSRLKFQKSTNLLLADKNKEINSQNIELQSTQDQLLQSNLLLEEKNDLLGEKNEEINSKNEQLEASNEDLAQFAYVASHDLKEPLRMINSYTKLLKKRYNDLYDDTGKEFIDYVVDAAQRMESMLTDLLAYSRVGTQNPQQDWVDSEKIMFITEANLRARLEEENAKLVYNPKNFPAVQANKTHMTQLLQNLVSNAIKFRGDRDPIVEVNCSYAENYYTFSVKDNGIGISEDNLKKVFEMFRRLHTRDEYEGTGIGLATCKKIVSKLGGEIWVESVYGEGSTFFFTIPCPVKVPETVEG